MAHPFFETTRFPAHRTEAVDLHRILCLLYGSDAQVRYLYERSIASPPGLTYPATVESLWHEALRNITKTQTGLKNLCRFVKTEYPTNREAQNIILGVENAMPIKEIRIFANDIIFLDRVPIRTSIEQIAPGTTAKKVLVVRGSSQTGKSFLKHLTKFTALEYGAIPIYLYAGNARKLTIVLDRLFKSFGPDKKPPPTDTTDAGYYQVVCNELLALAEMSQKEFWITVDDLGERNGAPLLDPEIKMFFDQFALNMLDPPFAKSFRLILIHYPEEVPTLWDAEMYLENEVKAEDIQQGDIEILLKEWLSRTNQYLSEEKIKLIAEEVINVAEAEYEKSFTTASPNVQNKVPPSRLKLINHILTERIQKM